MNLSSHGRVGAMKNQRSVINTFDPGDLMSWGQCGYSWEMVGWKLGACFEWQPTDSGRRPQKFLCAWTRTHVIFELWVKYDNGTNKSRNSLIGIINIPGQEEHLQWFLTICMAIMKLRYLKLHWKMIWSWVSSWCPLESFVCIFFFCISAEYSSRLDLLTGPTWSLQK